MMAAVARSEIVKRVVMVMCIMGEVSKDWRANCCHALSRYGSKSAEPFAA